MLEAGIQTVLPDNPEATQGYDPAVPCYAGGIDLEFTLEALLAQTDGNLAKGFRAIKMKVGRPRLSEDAARVAARRTSELMAETGLADLRAVSRQVLERSEQAMRAAIRAKVMLARPADDETTRHAHRATAQAYFDLALALNGVFGLGGNVDDAQNRSPLTWRQNALMLGNAVGGVDLRRSLGGAPDIDRAVTRPLGYGANTGARAILDDTRAALCVMAGHDAADGGQFRWTHACS